MRWAIAALVGVLVVLVLVRLAPFWVLDDNNRLHVLRIAGIALTAALLAFSAPVLLSKYVLKGQQQKQQLQQYDRSY
jgi:branched-subunit amino acid transport protein AzlD